jgi:hypothetical protein
VTIASIDLAAARLSDKILTMIREREPCTYASCINGGKVTKALSQRTQEGD